VGDIWAGKAEEEGDALVVEAEDGGDGRDGELAIGAVAGEALAEGEEGHDFALRAGDFDFDLALVAVDAAGGSAEVEGDLFGKVGQLADPDTEGGGEVEADEAWGDGAAGDAGGDLVAGEDHLNAVRLKVQRSAHSDCLPSITDLPVTSRTPQPVSDGSSDRAALHEF
ncbi:MAG TPA: hypothetical protein VLY63_16665, partial [Anaerolineae bacterium]|nr:hypothetical protein [Anaerolineae bacterium]